MSNELINRGTGEIIHQGYSEEQVQLIKNTFCKGASDDELKLFMYVAKKTGLDIFSRQIYSVERWDNKIGKYVRAIQVAIDGFRVVAERSGKYAGQVGPYWCGKDGQWVDVWLDIVPPVAAKVGVLRSDFKEPVWAVARYDAFLQTYRDKQTGKFVPNQFWTKMPDLMIAKVAESQALRKAFPQDLSGLYTSDEMPQEQKAQEVALSEEELEIDYPVPPHEKICGPEYRIQNGKLRGKQFRDLTEDELEDYADILLKRGAKQKPWERELHTHIVNYLREMRSLVGENPPMDEAEIIAPAPVQEVSDKTKEARTAAMKALYALCGKVWKDKSPSDKVLLVQNVLGIDSLRVLETWAPNQIMNLMQKVDEWALKNAEPPLVDPFPMDPKDWPEPVIEELAKKPAPRPSFRI